MTIPMASPNAVKTAREPAGRRGGRLPPAIIFGGNDNALSLARSLGRRGIAVYVLNKPGADVAYSRFARPISLNADRPFEAAALDFLLSSASDPLAGSVLLAACDDALELMAENREELSQRFLLDISNPEAQLQMLDKLTTYQLAEKADVPTPKFWRISARTDLPEIEEPLVYPLIVKPVLSHVFQQTFKSKFLIANDSLELDSSLRQVEEAGIDVFLVEKIPGPDSALCSYYTYLDEDGRPLFDFTKRVIRRYPANMGLATYHVTDYVPGVKEPSLRLFQSTGLRGLANAEFKYDARDGRLKLIECNARFTAANGLVARAGIDLGSLVYNRIVGLPLPPGDHFKKGLTLWDPLRDYKAFRELRRGGELTFWQWIRSIARPHQFPSFAWTDPLPALARLMRRFHAR